MLVGYVSYEPSTANIFNKRCSTEKHAIAMCTCQARILAWLWCHWLTNVMQMYKRTAAEI